MCLDTCVRVFTCRRAAPGYWGTCTLRGRSSFCSRPDRGWTGAVDLLLNTQTHMVHKNLMRTHAHGWLCESTRKGQRHEKRRRWMIKGETRT